MTPTPNTGDKAAQKDRQILNYLTTDIPVVLVLHSRYCIHPHSSLLKMISYTQEELKA